MIQPQQRNGLTLVSRRRRRYDFGDVVAIGLVCFGLVLSALLTLAVAVGAVWLIVVILLDLARRLGLS